MAANNYNYISLISLLVDDEINPHAIDVFNHEGFTDLMGLMGRYKESKQPVYHNYINQDLAVQGDTTGATVGGSGTATVTTTFTAGTSGYTFKNQLVMFPNGKVGHVQAVTAGATDAVTIESVDGTNLTHTAGQKLDLFSVAFGEASVAPTNIRYGLTKYVNNIQKFRLVNEETDVAKVSMTRVTFNGQPYMFSKNLIEKYIQHKAHVNGALFGGNISATLFSDTTPTLTDPDAGTGVQTTRGLNQYATTYGVSDTVATPGTWLLSDHSDVIDQLIAKRAKINSYKMLMPSKVKGKIDDTLKNLGSANTNSVRLNADANSTTKLNFWVDEFNYKGMVAQMAVLPILDHSKMYSQTDIVKSVYYMPMDSVKTNDNGMQPRVQIRYQSHGLGADKNQGDKIWGEWHSGPLSPVKGSGNIGEDKLLWRCNWITNQGLEVLGAEHLAKSVVLV